MNPDEAVRPLLEALRDVLRRARMPLAVASRDLGREPSYLTRALSGRYRLRVQEVFELLLQVQMHPWHFFTLYFPLGGAGMVEMRQPELATPDGLARLAERAQLVATAHDAALGGWDLAEWIERVSLVLRERIQAHGLSQRAVAEALGFSPGAFGQALRGGTALKARHVFGALAVLGINPGRFFFEVIFPGRSLVAGITWSRLLDEIEPQVEAAAQRVVARRKAGLPEPRDRREPQPAPPEPGANGKG